jgi:nucleoside phosphorylase
LKYLNIINISVLQVVFDVDEESYVEAEDVYTKATVSFIAKVDTTGIREQIAVQMKTPIYLLKMIIPDKIYFEADQKISQKLTDCVVALGGKALAGCIASGDQFVAAPEKKAYIKETFGAIACEMEGGAIAHVATVNGTPFAVLRAISDSADGDATMDYPTFSRLAAERSVATLRAYLRSL